MNCVNTGAYFMRHLWHVFLRRGWAGVTNLEKKTTFPCPPYHAFCMLAAWQVRAQRLRDIWDTGLASQTGAKALVSSNRGTPNQDDHDLVLKPMVMTWGTIHFRKPLCGFVGKF